MCGISGIVSRQSNLDPSLIRTLTHSLRHRGPDDEGYLAVDFKTKNISQLIGNDSKVPGTHIDTFTKQVDLALGHRRLSIIDTSPAGHQPMPNQDQTLWIVYNGEIYNYIELREELCQSGYHFRTQTDTEVILAAYQQWGMDCIRKFNGMWAFVILDIKKNILFGSRDRFGVKPLYYSTNSDFFSFASELKAFLQLPFLKREINSSAVFDYLILGREEREEESLFKGIFELPPSHCFTFSIKNHEFKKWRYYELTYNPDWVTFDPKKMNQYKKDIENLIFQAVALRLRSDVPVGSCLSGGIDSSSIVCVINRLLQTHKYTQVGDRQKALTACYKNSPIDESRWAKIVIDATATTWHKTYPSSKNLMRDLETLVHAQDIPFGSTSIYAQHCVMKLAKDSNLKVLLDGQGGDELFTGYTPFYQTFFLEIMQHHDATCFFREFHKIRNSPVTTRSLISFLIKFGVAKSLPRNLVRILSQRTTNSFHFQYTNKDFFNSQKDRLKAAEGSWSAASLNKTLFDLMTASSLKSLLRYEDRNSMHFGIESRTPFADDINLIEYVFSIPSVYKIHDGWSKCLLRGAMEDILPKEIHCRKDKLGFNTPEYQWLSEAKDELRTYITCVLDDYIDTDLLLKDWDQVMAYQPKFGITKIWRILNLAIWLKVFFKTPVLDKA